MPNNIQEERLRWVNMVEIKKGALWALFIVIQV